MGAEVLLQHALFLQIDEESANLCSAAGCLRAGRPHRFGVGRDIVTTHGAERFFGAIPAAQAIQFGDRRLSGRALHSIDVRGDSFTKGDFGHGSAF